MSPPPPKRASYIQLETTRVEDKEFAACKAAIKIYLQQNKGLSRPQSILIILVSGQMLEATLMAGSLCFADLLLWPQPDRVLDPWH